MRGATAATNGSSKWPNKGPSHPSAGTQSESTNATSAVWTTAKPGVARAGRADVGGQADEARSVPLGDLLGRARIGRRVIDHDAGQTPEGIEHPVELCRPVAHRHHDRHVAVPEGAGRRLRDERAPRDQSPRQ